MFAHTSWVWWEEEGSLLPPLLCHCTFAIRWGRAELLHGIPVGAGDEQPAAPAGCSKWGVLVPPRGLRSPAPCCDAQHVAFPLAASKTLLKTLTKISCPWRNSPNGR